MIAIDCTPFTPIVAPTPDDGSVVVALRALTAALSIPAPAPAPVVAPADDGEVI